MNIMSSHRSNMPYHIQPEYIERLGGIMLQHQLPYGSRIEIANKTYQVSHVYNVTCKLYVASGILTVSYGDHRLTGTAKIKRFANLLGMRNHAEFIKAFFHNCRVQDTMAEADYYFHSFLEENIFLTW